jgi:hypothetical protein
MHIEAKHGTVLLKLGRRFTAPDAERLRQAVESLAPFSELTLDFTEVHELHDAAFLSLSRTLAELVEVKVVLRGLTLHQVRLLKYLGLAPAEPQTSA